MKSNKPVTTHDIARHAEVNQSTVSRALRNDPSISTRMREKILQAAKELEYRPNPFVSAFTAQVRGYRRSPQHASIAILNTQRAGVVRESDRRYTLGAVRRAEQLGFRADVFSFDALGRKPARFLQILHSRSIRGLLILPLPANEDLCDLNVDHLACATIDLSDHLPAISRTVPDYFRHMQIALSTLESYGYKRIGFCTTTTELVGFARYSLASYLLWQRQISAGNRIAEYVNAGESGDGGRGSFFKWLDKNRPDVVVSNEIAFLNWIKERGITVPGEIGFASLTRDQNTPSVAGIDQCQQIVGAAAMDLVIGHIFRNEYGLPDTMKSVFIDGLWNDGDTVRSTGA